MKNRIRVVIKDNFSLIVVIFVFLCSYLYKLTDFPYKQLTLSSHTFPNYSYFSNIWSNGYLIFYKLLLYFIRNVHLLSSVLILRLPAVIVAFCIVVISYFVIKKWHSEYLALMGSLLLLSWPLLLHLGRYQSSLVIYLLLIPSIYLIRIMSGSAIKDSRLYISLFLQSLIILIPGGIWFAFLSIYFNRKNLLTLFKNKVNLVKVILTLVSSLYWLPFIVNNMLLGRQQILYFFGLNNFRLNSLELLSTYFNPIKELFISGINNQSIWLPGIAIFNGFLITFFILGLIFYIRNFDANRSKLIIFSLVIAYILTIFNPNMLLVLSSAIFFISIFGVHSFISLWIKKFPINNIARTFAYSLVSLLILVSIFYNYRSYFIAWKYNQSTISSFDLLSNN